VKGREISPLAALVLVLAGFFVLTGTCTFIGTLYAEHIRAQDHAAKMQECIDRATRLGITITACYGSTKP
jgi:hypothetical protein